MNTYRVTFANGIVINVHSNNQWSARENAKRKYAMQYHHLAKADGGIPKILNAVLIAGGAFRYWR